MSAGGGVGWIAEARERNRILEECDLPACETDLIRALDALDAVLALHADDDGSCPVCADVDGDGMALAVDYPCPTRQAILGDENMDNQSPAAHAPYRCKCGPFMHIGPASKKPNKTWCPWCGTEVNLTGGADA